MLEEVKEASPDPKEDVEEPQPEEGDAEPTFVCGLLVIMLPDGKGLKLRPIEAPEYSRIPTLNDMLCIAAELDNHARSIHQGTKILEILEENGLIRTNRKKGIIH